MNSKPTSESTNNHSSSPKPDHTSSPKKEPSIDTKPIKNPTTNTNMTVANEFNDKPIKERLKIILSNNKYKRILPLIILWVFAGYMPAIFFSPWGAEQFSHCTARTSQEEAENACDIDYNSYNKMSALFSSFGGLTAFIFGGFIGRISDSYGRLPFLYMNVLLSLILYAPLVIVPNVWINFIMRIPNGLNSSDNSFTPTMMAYLSDIFPEHQRTMAYSVAYACCAIGLFLGVGLAVTLGIFIGDQANFVAISILDIIQIIYIYFRVNESLKVQNRKTFTTKNLNPLRPLYHCCCYHPIVLWVALVQFFISLPETGILDMSIIFILDQLNVQNETDAAITNAAFVVSCSVGLVLGPLVILPKLQGRNYSNIQILCIGVSLFFVGFVTFSLLAWIKSVIIPIIGGVLFTCGFISFPAANGIVTRYLTKSEQGIGFGVIFAVRSLTWIIAPISFAEMYSIFKENDIPFMTMYMAAFMIMFAMIIILGPLRRSINETDRLGKVYSFSTVELQMMDRNSRDDGRNGGDVRLDTDDKKKKQKKMDTVDHFETLDDVDRTIR